MMIIASNPYLSRMASLMIELIIELAPDVKIDLK